MMIAVPVRVLDHLQLALGIVSISLFFPIFSTLDDKSDNPLIVVLWQT